jgi:coenzyme F420 biosynthesis associated uncharacterized protein
MIDWTELERAAKVFATTGGRIDGSALLRLRSQILEIVDEATAEVEREAALPATPKAELMVVDRHAWIGGNVRTLERLFGGMELSGPQAKVVAWEGGAFVGLIARAVLGQYDPYRDQLLVVYPNLGVMADAEGLRWLLFHEVTHVAQFRAAPWISDYIVELGRTALDLQRRPDWTREAIRQIPERLPELVKWARQAFEGKATTTPFLDFLPQEQREAIEHVNAIVTVLEGHATLVTELIAKRVLPNHEEIDRRLAQRRKRPPLIRFMEALGGIEMKRQQYILGRSFCEAVWAHGGPSALAPVWRGPEWMPTLVELREPESWLERAHLPGGLPQPA